MTAFTFTRALSSLDAIVWLLILRGLTATVARVVFSAHYAARRPARVTRRQPPALYQMTAERPVPTVGATR